MKSMRKLPNRFLTPVEIDGVERMTCVYVDIQPAEPDVGVFSESVEIESVSVIDNSLEARIKRRILGEKPRYNVSVMSKLDETELERIRQVVYDELDSWNNEP